MKRYFLLFFFSVISIFAYSQTVNGIEISKLKAEYCLIMGYEKFMSTKVNVMLDFGQEDKLWKAKDTQVLGKDGKPIIFNSMMHALNFMHDNGYEFMNAYAISVGNQNVYHWLLKRKKN